MGGRLLLRMMVFESLCCVFGCQTGDILVHVPDPPLSKVEGESQTIGQKVAGGPPESSRGAAKTGASAFTSEGSGIIGSIMRGPLVIDASWL
jgi:hypothetical protein